MSIYLESNKISLKYPYLSSIRISRYGIQKFFTSKTKNIFFNMFEFFTVDI